MLRRALVGFSPRTLILIIKQEIVDEQAEERNILPYQRQREAKEHIVNRMENRCSRSSKILLSSISGGGGAAAEGPHAARTQRQECEAQGHHTPCSSGSSLTI